MRKWLRFTSPLVITFILLSFAFKPAMVEVPETLKITEPTEVLFPKNKTTRITTMLMAPPFLGSSYIGFKEALAFNRIRFHFVPTDCTRHL